MGSSYIYMLLRDGIYVISTATGKYLEMFRYLKKNKGLIVKIFKDHLQKIDKSLRNKFEFDQLQIYKNKELYLASSV